MFCIMYYCSGVVLLHCIKLNCSPGQKKWQKKYKPVNRKYIIFLGFFGFGVTIRICQEIQYLPLAGFFLLLFSAVGTYFTYSVLVLNQCQIMLVYILWFDILIEALINLNTNATLLLYNFHFTSSWLLSLYFKVPFPLFYSTQ